MLNKDDVLDKVKRQRKKALSGLAVQYDNTRLCQAFYNSNDMEYTDSIQFKDTDGRKRRARVNFNDVQSPVDTFVGFLIQNRRVAKYLAHGNAGPQYQMFNKNMNSIAAFHRKRQRADQKETRQDYSMAINGYGAIETDLSYVIGNSTSLPNGEILMEKLDDLSVYWDTSARDTNLLDAAFCGYDKIFDLDDALALIPDSDEDDFQFYGQQNDRDNDDNGFQYNPNGGVYDRIRQVPDVEWSNEKRREIVLSNHQWFEYEDFYRCKNPAIGAMVENMPLALYYKQTLDDIIAETADEYDEDDIKAKEKFALDSTAPTLVMTPKQKALVKEAFGDLVKPVKLTRKCYYTCVFSGEHIFKTFKSISQSGFSVKFKTGIYDYTGMKWQGLVNAMMEPANVKNKLITEFLFTVAANSKGGTYIEEDAVEDIAEFEKNVARTDAVIKVNSGALSAGKIQDKTRPSQPNGMGDLIQLCDASLVSNGVNEAVMGIANDNESGILFKRKVRQAISKLAPYVDSTASYQEDHAQLMADYIPVWAENNTGEIVRLIGDGGQQEFLQISADVLAPAYDVDIQEAPQTPEEQQEVAAMLDAKAQFLAQLGNSAAAVVFETEALQMLPLDGDVRQRLVDALKQPSTQADPEKQQMQQLIQQLQAPVTQAEVGYKVAQTSKINAEVAAMNVGVQKDAASIIKTGSETKKIDLENQLLEHNNFKQPTVAL